MVARLENPLYEERLHEANRRLDEIAPSIRTQAGKVSFDAFRKRVNDVAQLCP